MSRSPPTVSSAFRCRALIGHPAAGPLHEKDAAPRPGSASFSSPHHQGRVGARDLRPCGGWAPVPHPGTDREPSHRAGTAILLDLPGRDVACPADVAVDTMAQLSPAPSRPRITDAQVLAAMGLDLDPTARAAHRPHAMERSRPRWPELHPVDQRGQRGAPSREPRELAGARCVGHLHGCITSQSIATTPVSSSSCITCAARAVAAGVIPSGMPGAATIAPSASWGASTMPADVVHSTT